jgi:hypothetical protein
MRALRHDQSTGEYLAFLSIKYELNPEEFFSALLMAEAHKKSTCGELSIECRGKVGTEQIFLMKNESGVVAQFRVPEDFLLKRGDPLGKFMETNAIRRHLSKKSNPSHSQSIKDLRSGMNHVSLKGKILEIAKPNRVVTRYGNYADVAKAVIADETGKINLCLWNEQIASVSVGDTVQIENARACTFKGEKQLIIGVKGILSSVDEFESSSEPLNLPAAKA